MLNGLCSDDDYTVAQWLEHRWPQAKVPGLSPGGDGQCLLQTFPFSIPSTSEPMHSHVFSVECLYCRIFAMDSEFSDLSLLSNCTYMVAITV